MDQYVMKIIENKQIANNIYLMILEHKDTNEKKSYSPKPGQFIYIRVNDVIEPLLRRPISIHDYDPAKKQTKLIYRVQGQGTKGLSRKKTGDELDIMGPLGNGYNYHEINSTDQIVVIGGGIGIPPLYYLAKELVNIGTKLTILLGFQSKTDSYLIEEFSQLGDVRIASIDGSLGIKGTALDLINSSDNWDTFYSCGPTGMMRAIKDKWIDIDINGYFSLEERMGCGVGACYGCIVKVDTEIEPKGYKKVCSDGPVFPFREVIL